MPPLSYEHLFCLMGGIGAHMDVSLGRGAGEKVLLRSLFSMVRWYSARETGRRGSHVRSTRPRSARRARARVCETAISRSF